MSVSSIGYRDENDIPVISVMLYHVSDVTGELFTDVARGQPPMKVIITASPRATSRTFSYLHDTSMHDSRERLL